MKWNEGYFLILEKKWSKSNSLLSDFTLRVKIFIFYCQDDD